MLIQTYVVSAYNLLAHAHMVTIHVDSSAG